MTGYERIKILFRRINYSEPIIICCLNVFCWILNFFFAALHFDVYPLVIALTPSLSIFRAPCNLKPVTIVRHVVHSLEWNVTVKHNFAIFRCEFHRKVLVCDSSIWIWWAHPHFWCVHIILVWTKPVTVAMPFRVLEHTHSLAYTPFF